MKKLLIPALLLLNQAVSAQDKFSYVSFNKLTEVSGTPFMIAAVDHMDKMSGEVIPFLLFIDTQSGTQHRLDLPGNSFPGKPEQLRIDSLGINLILLQARTVDLDGKKGIDWNDPAQVFILSTDGRQMHQLTDSSYFVRTRAINHMTGTLVVTGHYDSNNNHKYDTRDRNEIQVFDLKSGKLLYKI